MASHNIFIGDQEVYDKELGINSSYTYSNGSLRVYNKGRVVYFVEAKKGDAFVVICKKGKAFLKKMVPPTEEVHWYLGCCDSTKIIEQVAFRSIRENSILNGSGIIGKITKRRNINPRVMYSLCVIHH